jgi:hypothetical protein
MRNILIVDGDLGFVFWLGQALDRAGYQALPARTCEDATELVSQLHLAIHILIVNGLLPDAGALAMALRASDRHLKVIAVTGEGDEQSSVFPEADAFHRKCSGGGEAAEREWLETIEGVFASKTPEDSDSRTNGGHASRC